ncbi:MAG: cardiolipin synthase [Lachnospiraceae bacterium]
MARQQVIDKDKKHGDYTLFLDKLIWVIIIVLLQIFFIIYTCFQLKEKYIIIEAVMSLISLLVVLYIINRPINPAYKLAWCIPILLAPILGGAFYLLLSVNQTRREFRKGIRTSVKESKKHLDQDSAILEELKTINSHSLPQANCIFNQAGYPVHKNQGAQYFSSGEEYFEQLLIELENAKKFIFIEFFIIQEGIFWNSVLEILKRKAKEGVDIKVIYDDMGSLQTLPPNYYKQLQEMGIEAHCFNPVSATLSLRQNNRDHRKIIVIDGHTSFTGGVNLADEYINKRQKINGHWKDTGIMLKGEAAWNFTVMFLQFWEYLDEKPVDYEHYHIPAKELPVVEASQKIHTDGYVQPYADNPLFSEIIAENVYLNMIHRATNYVYITTPYLIVDNEMITALTLAAASGVDVRIITPHIPDKRTVFRLTRSFYEPLTKAGVKIYEYTPGFIHSKMMVVDDMYCAVGSINLDFRSLYLHFECASFIYHSSVIKEIKKDIIKTIEASEEITYEQCIAMNKSHRFGLSLLRLFAPLL